MGYFEIAMINKKTEREFGILFKTDIKDLPDKTLIEYVRDIINLSPFYLNLPVNTAESLEQKIADIAKSLRKNKKYVVNETFEIVFKKNK